MKIAQIASPKPLKLNYATFVADLQNAGFKGEINSSYAERLIMATDNSIYQRLPQAVIYPQNDADVICLMQVLADHPTIQISARGGGTGTNGQSLTTGITVDLSRNFKQILEINPKQKWVRVQAGVIKDELNLALKPYGLFFAPELSTSNRATIGGMINTDASGQGSCAYGKTSDHVLELDTVLLGGETLKSHAISVEELHNICAGTNKIANIYQTAYHIALTKKELIQEKFPKLNRALTGYDLAHLLQNDVFNLNSLLCGSEGSLGIITSAKLNVLPIPKYQVLVNVRYASFMDALRDAEFLMAHKPISIETVDSKVLQLAMQDIVWQEVAEYFPEGDKQTLGINLVEFNGNDQSLVDAQVAEFVDYLEYNQATKRLGHTVASGVKAVTTVYKMRKKAVGLLGNTQGESRPQPFVEDTAVPPHHLADYVTEFRQLLDSYNLNYGMFGHVDAGVLHVRPMLDMKNPHQAQLVRPISDAVVNLTAKYGGLLWGEHGKGIRSEYAPKFFGELYHYLQIIKEEFDPHNQLNPGKIATAADTDLQLLEIDKISTRGAIDQQIDAKTWQSFGSAMHCNGNGACFNFDPRDAMCPSYKATGKRLYSPKGRTALLKEWLRLQNIAGVDVVRINPSESWLNWLYKPKAKQDVDDFAHEVYQAFITCLACKSCAGSCPIKVNVPEFRSRFLQMYHGRYRRPLRDYAIAYLEFILPKISYLPRLYNYALGLSLSNYLLHKCFGLVDVPPLHPQAKLKNIAIANPTTIANLRQEQRQQSVIIVQDVFTRYFDTTPLIALFKLIAKLGFTPYLAPLMPNGKPLNVLGFLPKFKQTAQKTANFLEQFKVPLVGLDPAMTLAYRQEYAQINANQKIPQVLLPQEWLLQNIPIHAPNITKNYILLPHCTEKSTASSSNAQWQQVFSKFGLRLEIAEVGCCGMSGTYGHELQNLATSKKIFSASWAHYFKDPQLNNVELLSTGYSCRSQVKRFKQQQLRHPVEALLEHLTNP